MPNKFNGYTKDDINSAALDFNVGIEEFQHPYDLTVLALCLLITRYAEGEMLDQACRWIDELAELEDK